MNTESVILPSGEEGVLLTRQDYEDLIDARDHAVALREVASGASVLTDAELDAYLSAPTPLAFWRGRVGKTQAALAAAAGISQAFLAQIESGVRIGRIDVYARLAKALGLRMDDLVAE